MSLNKLMARIGLMHKLNTHKTVKPYMTILCTQEKNGKSYEHI